MADLASVVGSDVERALFPQQELLGLPPLPETRRGEIERRRAGRPVGARNKRSEDAARVAVERFGDPLLHQVAIATMPTEELAARLGCDPLEAAELQQRAAATCLPYLHSRKPLAVDVRNHRVVHLTIVDPLAPPAAPGEASEVEIVDVLEYQAVSEGDDAAL